MKKQHWIIGGVILLIIIAALIIWLKPFTFQKRMWLKKNTKPNQFSKDVAKMSSKEVEAAYCVLKKYKGDASKAPAAEQKTYAGLVAPTQGAQTQP